MLRRLGFVPLRLLQAIPVMFGVTLVVFFLVRLIPGDPAVTILGQQATAAKVSVLRHEMGLDKPLAAQYLQFLGKAIHGDFGESLIYHTGVIRLIAERLPVTLLLVLYAVVLMVVISIPIASLAASGPGKIRDHLVRIVPMIGIGMPQFWVGIMLLLIFAVGAGIFPVGGYGSTPVSHLWYLFLPALTLAIWMTPIVVRGLRSSMLNVLGSDYVVTARSKGIGGLSLFGRHVVRNSVIPMVSIVGVNLSYLVGGSLVIEQVFAIPGVGRLMIESILSRDFPTVQAVVLFIAIFVVVVGILTDVVYVIINPRVEITDRGGDE
jgi:peptide/nickel transport system permease protein